MIWRQCKPNILAWPASCGLRPALTATTNYGDLGPYGGGEGRGMPTPNIDRMANEGMTFFSFKGPGVAGSLQQIRIEESPAAARTSD